MLNLHVDRVLREPITHIVTRWMPYFTPVQGGSRFTYGNIVGEDDFSKDLRQAFLKNSLKLFSITPLAFS